MASIIHLETRETHRYVGTCSHMDRWQHVGRAKVLPARLVREGNGHDDCGTYLMTAKIPAGQDPAASKRALADHFTRWGCSHEYDCCGCVSTMADVRQVTPRTFIVAVSYSRNY
jgi:hypothetical protein